MPRTGFQLDLDLCTGCGACVVACTIENELPWGTSWRWVDTFNPERLPGIPVHHLSLACNHCAEAPCKEACPAVAYHRDPVTGAVLLDAEKCIGCRYCTWACPYDAPKFDASAGVVSKCTFCNHRQLEGLAPACVDQCPTGALTFGPLDRLKGEVAVPGFPSTAAAPGIRFVPRRRGSRPAREDAGGPEDSEGVPSPSAGPPGPLLHARFDARPCAGEPVPEKASFASEWPLWLFSLIVAAMAGLMASPAGRSLLSWPTFAVAMATAGGASTLHLGRKERAWRAVLGWRTSWLSREILLFALFAAAGTASLAGILPTARVAGLPSTSTAVAILGFLTLFAVDRVYRVTRSPGVERHSARVLPTGLLVAAVVAAPPLLWLTVLAYKLLLYGSRKHRFADAGKAWRPRVSALRIGSSLAGAAVAAGSSPAAVLLLGPRAGLDPLLTGGAPLTTALGLLLLAVGEAVDRAEFYQELTVPTPARQARADLSAAARRRARV